MDEALGASQETQLHLYRFNQIKAQLLPFLFPSSVFFFSFFNAALATNVSHKTDKASFMLLSTSDHSVGEAFARKDGKAFMFLFLLETTYLFSQRKTEM